jgi:C4-dicarboxylate-binding protein DctP
LSREKPDRLFRGPVPEAGDRCRTAHISARVPAQCSFPDWFMTHRERGFFGEAKVQHLVTFLAGVFFLTGWPQPSSAEPVRLRLSFQLPINGSLGTNLVRFKEAVERDTGNAIAIDILHGSQALPDRTVAKSVMAGEIELAAANVVTLAGSVKGVDILSLPFLFNSNVFLRTMLDPARPSRKLLDSAILGTGARVLMWQPYGTNVFFSKGRPVSRPTDIAGKKLRASGAIDFEFGRICGGTPEMIAAGAQHEAMKVGRVEMVMTAAENVSARKFWEISDTLTRTNHSTVILLLLVNERVWQSLTGAHRDALANAAGNAERELWDALVRADAEADAFARSMGMQVVELSSIELAEWRACSAAVVESFMAESGRLGHELLKLYGLMRADPCCNQAPDIGGVGYKPH